MNESISKFYAHRHMIGRYLVSGGTATLLDIVLLYILTRFAHLWYLASAVLAFIVAFGVSFTLQKFWTFRDHATDGVHRQAGKYLAVSVFNLGLNTLLVYAFTDQLHLWYIFSQILAAGLIALVSFFVYKRFIFCAPSGTMLEPL